MYSELKRRLRATGIPFASRHWANAPAGTSYGVIALDSEAESLHGDNRKRELAVQGTIDLFCRTDDLTDLRTVMAVLDELEVCWYWNSTQTEAEKRLVHYELVFELEAI